MLRWVLVTIIKKKIFLGVETTSFDLKRYSNVRNSQINVAFFYMFTLFDKMKKSKFRRAWNKIRSTKISQSVVTFFYHSVFFLTWFSKYVNMI